MCSVPLWLIRTRFHLLHLERRTLHNAHHDRCEAPVLARDVADDFANRRHVVVLHVSSERVYHQFFGDRLNELIGTLLEGLAKVARVANRSSIHELSGRIDERSRPTILRTPCADRVEILERESQRVHYRVASVTG